MSESKDELIARRDMLIASIQGSWAVDIDTRSINRKAILAGAISTFAFSVLLALFAAVMLLSTQEDKLEAAEISVFELMVYLAVFAFVVGTVFFVYIWGHALWYRRLNPIVIEANRLVWAKRERYVPERLDLHHVNSVIRYDGTGSSRLVMKIINRLDRNSSTSLSPVIFVSRVDHNTPKVIPAMFEDGHRLFDTVEQIADINTQLDEFDATERG
jgi:hypothetical protein